MKESDIKIKKLWEPTKQEMRAAIIERAKHRDQITYSELLNKVISLKLDTAQPDQCSIMAKMLGEISIAEDEAGRGMLSALVVHKTGDMEPGQGFFGCAKDLNRNVSDKTTCWVQETNKVHDYWAKH